MHPMPDNADILNASPEEQRRLAASIMGRKGGRAGTGAKKRQTPEVLQRAVKARIASNRRWMAYREHRRAQQAANAKATPSSD